MIAISSHIKTQKFWLFDQSFFSRKVCSFPFFFFIENVLASSGFFLVKVLAPSYFFDEKVLAPSDFFSRKVLTPRRHSHPLYQQILSTPLVHANLISMLSLSSYSTNLATRKYRNSLKFSVSRKNFYLGLSDNCVWSNLTLVHLKPSRKGAKRMKWDAMIRFATSCGHQRNIAFQEGGGALQNILKI